MLKALCRHTLLYATRACTCSASLELKVSYTSSIQQLCNQMFCSKYHKRDLPNSPASNVRPRCFHCRRAPGRISILKHLVRPALHLLFNGIHLKLLCDKSFDKITYAFDMPDKMLTFGEMDTCDNFPMIIPQRAPQRMNSWTRGSVEMFLFHGNIHRHTNF